MKTSSSKEPGSIITFYSYKGGTGRSMALANYACYLALRGNRTLIIDWDLEAPGLHRFFPGVANLPAGDGPKGVIEYFGDLRKALGEDENLYAGIARFDGLSQLEHALPLRNYVIPNVFTDSGSVDFMRAGQFGPGFAERVGRFAWVDFFAAYPLVFRVLRELLASRYAVCLIDSRTGLTDTSGICTMLMPEKLVAVFTPNMQSLDGVIGLLKG